MYIHQRGKERIRAAEWGRRGEGDVGERENVVIEGMWEGRREKG